MTIYEINDMALTELSRSHYRNAQELFFENAKSNPCHVTFNNLGYFLCTEGFWSNDGKHKHAEKLGMNYLVKATQFNYSIKNLCAMATGIDKINMYTVKNENNFFSYENAYNIMNNVVKIYYSDLCEYNRLYFLYLCDPNNENLLRNLKKLIKIYKRPESITLYAYALCDRERFDECISCLKKYRDQIDIKDQLKLYYICGAYEKGAALLKHILSCTGLDKVEAAIMIECLAKTNKVAEARMFAEHEGRGTKGYADSGSSQNRCPDSVFRNLTSSSAYRRNLIQKNRSKLFKPTHMQPCAYLGCKQHTTLDTYGLTDKGVEVVE